MLKIWTWRGSAKPSRTAHATFGAPRAKLKGVDPVGMGTTTPWDKRSRLPVLAAATGPPMWGPFAEVVQQMRVIEDPGLLPMVVPAFSAPLPPNPLTGLPPHGASLAEVLQLQKNFEKLTELLTNVMGNVEKMNARVGELERKVQGSLPQVGRNKDKIKAFGARVKELALFKNMPPEFVHAHFNLRITEFEQYLVSHGFRQTLVPPPSAPPPARTSHSSFAPSVPRPGPSGEPPRVHVPPVPTRPASMRLPDVAPGPSFAPSTPYNAPIDSFDLSHPSSSPKAPSRPEIPVPGPSFSTPTAYPRPDPHYTMYDPRPDGGYPPLYSSPSEESLGLLGFPVTTDLGGLPEAMVQPIMHGSPLRAPAMPSPVASSTVMTASFPGAARIFDYAKEMNAPTFDLQPEKFAETERMWDSWIFYQLMGCPDALVDRAKRDLPMQRCIPSLREFLKLMHSERPTLTFSEALHFVEDSVFVDRPGVPKKDFFSYNLQLRHNEPLTYSTWASYIAKYKRLRARVEDFDDQSEMEHLLAQLPPFYARKIAEAEAADGRVRPVVKVTCHDPVSVGQQIVQQMVRHSLGKPLKMVAKRNCVLIHCGSVDQAAYAKKFHRVAHPTGGHAPIKVQQLVGRWSADRMIAWVTSKLQDEAKRGVHSADRGVAPAQNADKCQQRRQDGGNHGGNPRGGNPPGSSKDRSGGSGGAAINEVSKEDWQKRITSGGVLGFDHFVQQYPQGSGCYACYQKFEGNHARKKDWSHNHSTGEVCQSFVKANQQGTKYSCGSHYMKKKFRGVQDCHYIRSGLMSRGRGRPLRTSMLI